MHEICVTFWLGLGVGFGLIDVALAIASCTYGLVNIRAHNASTAMRPNLKEVKDFTKIATFNFV